MRPGPVAGLILALVVPVKSVAAQLEHVGTFFWQAEVASGLSGIEVAPDGVSFEMVSDRGWLIAGRFERDGGRIVGLAVDRYVPLLTSDGFPVSAYPDNAWSDAEGIAVLPDGTRYVSFERGAHVRRYDVAGGRATIVVDHPSFDDYAENRQLEAIAVDPEARIVAIPEQAHRSTRAFPVYRLDDAGWTVVGRIAPEGRFAIVGADYGPDGRLYVLERAHILGRWWRSRIRRFDAPGGAGEVLWTSRHGAFHNLEGIAVWSDGDAFVITLVSDDNLRSSEPAQFVELRLTGGVSAR